MEASCCFLPSTENAIETHYDALSVTIDQFDVREPKFRADCKKKIIRKMWPVRTGSKFVLIWRLIPQIFARLS